MKNVTFILMTALVVVVMAACKDGKPAKEVKPIMVAQENPETLPEDTTIYGKCTDATTMNTLYLVDAKGDTLEYVIGDDANVLGGRYMGDKMAVITEEIYGEEMATKVINIMSLMGRWKSLDKDFEIKDGGVIESHQEAETKTFTSWKIFNGKLILAPDTFEINELGPDSMILENKNGIYGFRRIIVSPKK